VKRENGRSTIMHPMFVRLFIETDTDDLLTEEQDRKSTTARSEKKKGAARVKGVFDQAT
jgi:hypothetical protein